ncbi:Detected protein of confused Function [Hibiscus syriacus]|uniref:Detected protein of confused Function n=1 Tax=Hibiscus syriacus TaxID=106335 RepID=A0A6A3B292_HIBSY|nr:Detected protein of confused Function [Hibiscus syriacus]
MEQENNKNVPDITAVDLVKSESPEKKSSNISKAKSDIAKSVANNFLKTRKANVTSEVQRKKQKKKSTSVSEGSKAIENDVMKLNSMEENQQKDATTSMEHVEKSQKIQKNQENTSASDSKAKITKSNDNSNKRRSGEEPGPSNRNTKNEEKGEGNKRRKRNEEKDKHSNSVRNNTSDEKRDGKGKKQEIIQKEKIDGLIFMCNAKTKPDCFRYHVMGVSAGKKELVMGIRPGVKLFLYDYDLKLLYGIYKASSGGMKLEPNAFGGAFPAQVRFSVHADCFPLAENIFKKAIKENYYEKNKFKTELTARQIRKLTELFRPVPVQSTAPPFQPPSEVHDRKREVRPPSHRQASLRDLYANISARSYAPLERDQRVGYGELASTEREDGPHDFYPSEKEYTTYGLLGERINLTSRHHISPRLTAYLGDHRETPLRQPDTVYREPVPFQRDTIHSDPVDLTEREYRTYDLGATQEMQPTVSARTANTSVAGASILDSFITDPYYGRYSGDPLVDAYLPRPREAHLVETETDLLRRRESNQVDRLYSAYASDALIDQNQMHRHRDFKPASASTSVSSRYAFGGSSLFYR